MYVTPSLARRLAVAALVLCALAGLMIAALVATANRSASAVAVPEVVEPAPTAPVLVAALGTGTELPANADELLAAADRVCEGFAAEVPVTTMELTLSTDLGITLPEAHDLVAAAATTHCPAPVAVESPAPRRTVAPVLVEAPVVVASAPVVVEQPAPVVEEEVAEQSPEEAIGGARCDNPEQVVVAIGEDGEYVCGDA